jgi:hypothetical protein
MSARRSMPRRLAGGLAFLILFALLAGRSAEARQQAAAERQLIRLQAATFDPLVDGQPTASAESLTASAAGPYYIIQFNGPVEAIWVEQIERLGAQLLGYIPDDAHVARIRPEDVAKIRQMYAVRWVGPYLPDYKLAPPLAGLASAQADAQAPADVYVIGFAGEPADSLAAFLGSLGAQIVDAADTAIGVLFHARVPAGQLPQIARHPAVSWVEPYQPLKLDNSEARKILNVDGVWQTSGLFGAGQIVAISDSGLSVQGNLNADFGNRLKRAFAPSEMGVSDPACNAKTTWTDLNGHGTHVAGSVLGNGINSGSNPAGHQYIGSFAGAAPEAQLVFMAQNTDGSNSQQCIPLNGGFLAKGYDLGARISSNSWGADDHGLYSLFSSIVDSYIWNHKDYTVLYAAGNAGANGPQTIGSPGTAKNVITVGASENNRPGLGPIADNPNQVASFSSRGPTADGRIKPDVVAPGTRIVSVLGAQAAGFGPIAPGVPYALSDGTSMATPLTAGTTALAREWLAKQRGMPNPSAAFVKALMIHGALRLPGAAMPSNDSGWGRVDLKNVLAAQYAVFDDHLQGLSTGETLNYSLQVAGSNGLATLFVNNRSQAIAPSGLTLSSSQPPTSTATLADPSSLSVVAVAGYDAPKPIPGETIPTISGAGKDGLPELHGRAAPAAGYASGSAGYIQLGGGPTSASYLHNMVGGGGFEEPAWSSSWSRVWLGSGRPVVTSDSRFVLGGRQSLWLGGTETDDALWYPVSFPDQIDSSETSELTFLFQLRDIDPGFDGFCVALADESGQPIGGVRDCYQGPSDGITEAVTYQYTRILSESEKAALADESGYLVLYTYGDKQLPHLSAFVDDVALTIDYPDPSLGSTPDSGPAGTTFLLEGHNYLPYSAVEICPSPCDGSNAYDVVYAEADGDIAAYLRSTTDTAAGGYDIQARDIAGRTAELTITVHSNGQPELTVEPSSGPAGTTFSFTGANFVPGDPQVDVRIYGKSIGTVSSDDNGAVHFTIQTRSNTPPGNYQLQIADSSGRSASLTYQVTSAQAGTPTLTVTPQAGPAGSSFAFSGSNFAANASVAFALDGQPIGQEAADADGAFNVTLSTTDAIPPGTYTLVAAQGNAQASAQFQITGGGSSGPSGSGIYVTLAWTDPPAQANAAAALVNNLDLRVDGPGGPYFGNGGSGPDTKNNVEAIRLERPAPGTYTISVRAAGVNATFGAQPFALIATTAQNFGANAANAGIQKRVFLPFARR